MLHSYVTDMAARVTPTIQIPNFAGDHAHSPSAAADGEGDG